MTSFSNTLEAFKPTASQRTMAKALDRFLASSNQVFLMMGGAGTGKTFTLGKLVSFLCASKRSFRLMAPTGRAAKVLSERTGAPASTIHRSIYQMNQLKEYKVEKQDGSETYKFFFELAINSDSVDTIYIVDETSMVSDVYAETEFFRFGSGYLLKDLLSFAGFGLPGRRHKIIFCGDPAQLPPVGSDNSPALSENTLVTDFNLSCSACEMEEVVRQKAGSGILKNASRLRHQIRTDDLTSFGIEPAPDVLTQESGLLLAPWLAACKQDSMEQTIIVAWSNRQVYDFNNIIREHLFGAPTPVVVPRCHSFRSLSSCETPRFASGGTSLAVRPGDRILVVRNNYSQDIPLLNGEFGYVVKASSHVERETVFINNPIDGKRHNVRVDLAFRRVTLRFDHPEGGFVAVDCLVNENLLNNDLPQPTSDECRALYVDFKNRHPDLDPHTAAFREALCMDRRFNSLQIKFGYAVTAHKAQGGEWRNAFVDFSRGKQSVYTQDYFRWAYTAMTRASQQLYVMNAPQFTRLTARSRVDEPSDAITPLLMSPADASAATLPIALPEDQPGLAALYQTMDTFAKSHGITLMHVRHFQYNEAYMLKLDEMTCGIFNIHYNNQQRITSIYPAPGNPTVFQPIAGDLERLLTGKRMAAAMNPETAIPPPKVRGTLLPHHELFCDTLQETLSESECHMVAITVNGPYHLTCCFADKTGEAGIHYYFNGDAQLTRVIPHPQESTSSSLLASLLELNKKPGISP